MILEGNERGYGAELARHLLNPRDNDHVTVHAIEGFIADDLLGAFAEAEAISRATRCKKYLFSLSLNPPPGASVSVDVFEGAVAQIEKALGLEGQPRAVVFHEKIGRRHAHAIWSRIDAQAMKAINLSHYKRRLFAISRDLYRIHEWKMPLGFRRAEDRDPLNYSRAEAAQAKRLKRDPKAMKAVFRRCWEMSDSGASFEAALREHGFLLARGNRRGFVAVDGDGKIWSLSRGCGVKPKELRARLGSEDRLPSVMDVQVQAPDLPPPAVLSPDPKAAFQRVELVARQRDEREALVQNQAERKQASLKARSPRGLRAVFLRMSGQTKRVIAKADTAHRREQEQFLREQQALIERHLAERRTLDREMREQGLKPLAQGRDTRQGLVLPPNDLPYSKAELEREPARILEHLSKTKATFKRADVLRALAERIDDPKVLGAVADAALRSPNAVRLPSDGTAHYTTRDYLNSENRLHAAAVSMARAHGFHVRGDHVQAAIRNRDAQMQRDFGGHLSDEQKTALHHVLRDNQLACVVGLAGAGKSTMLEAAAEAWARQGLTVHGAALAGKAADGLQSAAGIECRTLASLELAWENGYKPIARGDVLVVDEAGMIGTRQLSRIACKLNEIGAKLVLVGDPEQLQPIEAGEPFRDLIARHGAAEMTEIHRQRSDWQREASRDLASGRTSEAMKRYAERDGVMSGEDRDAAIMLLVESFAMDATLQPNASRLALAHRRKDVHALNVAIRGAMQKSDAELEVLLQTETGPRAFAAGDRIVFGRNDKQLGVKNGMLGTVTKVSNISVTVALDGKPPRLVTFDPRQYREFDHGYAVTIHKSQGATVDRAFVLASRSMDRHLAYVALTRHRDEMRLFLNGLDRPDWSAMQTKRKRSYENPPRDGPSMG